MAMCGTSVMWHVSGELHDASLRSMRRLMQCLLMLPPSPHLHLKLLYTIVLLSYLIFIFHWRFSFNYKVVYDFRNDHFSRIIDLCNFATLSFCHCVVVIELIWMNTSERIEQQLERMRYVLRMQFGHKVNLLRVRRYCNYVILMLAARCLALMAVTIYNNMVTDTSILLIYAYYSEVVLMTRFSEFTLYTAMILIFYLELRETSCRLVMELDKTRCEVKSVRSLSLERLFIVQQLHGMLWNTVRSIERNFELSLVTMMLKYFVDTHVLPYWMFVNAYNHVNIATAYYCSVEELCKLLAIIVPCLICTLCERLQRQIRSIFHGVTTDRCNEQLNIYLYRVSAQLGQERCQLTAGGLLVINNQTLGKFVFGMVSYIVICIQFRMSLIDKSPPDATENTVTDDVLFSSGEFL